MKVFGKEIKDECSRCGNILDCSVRGMGLNVNDVT